MTLKQIQFLSTDELLQNVTTLVFQSDGKLHGLFILLNQNY